MDSALSPREIQARIRNGASITEVAEEAGVDVERIEAFAGPVIAEREHMTRTALGATVRRRGDGTGHRRLRDIIRERLQARGMDADEVVWDSWRLPDLKWRLAGRIDDDAGAREAEFTFDPKGRFNVASNADARWMIGEQLPGVESPDNENTVDFQDELALVRATQDQASLPGDDVPTRESIYDEARQTSELDDLYDMMSGISEDSVRIYVGLDEDEPGEAPPAEFAEGTEPGDVEGAVSAIGGEEPSEQPSEEPAAEPVEAPAEPQQGTDEEPSDQPSDERPVLEPEQDALVEAPEEVEEPKQPAKKATRRGRAKIPSWDEIMFGGPTKDA